MLHERPLPTALAVALAAALPAQEGHLLRYSFEQGSQARYVMTQTVETDMDIGERSMDMSMVMKLFMVSRVKEVREDSAVLEHRFERITMKMHNPMSGDTELDTDDEDSVPTMFDALLDMVGQHIEVELDDRGKILAVEVPDSLDELSGGAQLDFDQMIRQSVVALPEGPVAIGDKWNTSMSQSMARMGEIDVKVENELVAVEGDRVTLAQRMEMDLEGMEGGPIPLDMKVEDAVGKLVLDLGAGLVDSMEMTMVMTMTSEGGPAAMEMKMDMTMDMRRAPAPPEEEEQDGAGPRDSD